MKNIVKIEAAKRRWNIFKEQNEYTLKIMNGREEVLGIGPLPENIVKVLKDSKIID